MRKDPSVEARLVQLIEAWGPRTGSEIRAALGGDSFDHWRAAVLSERLVVRRVGTRYLRLDQRVEGFARLSPSILREFLTYSVVGLAGDPQALERRAAELAHHVSDVSRVKLEVARRVAAVVTEAAGAGTAASAETVAGALAESGRLGEVGKRPRLPFCILLAGDVVYQMAHDVPRPERSTGRMVRGSDLDIVVLVEDEAPPALLAELDDLVYRQKYRYLINPAAREEIDYVVKPLARVREQIEFDTFKKMVACKIIEESVLLSGNPALFEEARSLLQARGVMERLAAMKVVAARQRELAERRLLETERLPREGPDSHLFYTAEESEEFE